MRRALWSLVLGPLGAAVIAWSCGTFSSSTSAPVDAGGETGASSGGPDSAPRATWCTSQDAAFCADFDESNDAAAVFGLWSSESQTNGTLTLANVAGLPSPPNALVATGFPNCNVALLKHITLPQTFNAINVAFNLRIEDAGPTTPLSPVGVVGVAYGDLLTEGVVGLTVTSGLAFQIAWEAPNQDSGSPDAGGFATTKSSKPFPGVGTWLGRYTLVLTFAPGPPCVQVNDGVSDLATPCMPLPPALQSITKMSVAIGSYESGLQGGGSTGTFDIDDVLVTFE